MADVISRRLSPLCSLAPRLKNTKVPVWTHESIQGTRKGTSAIGTRQFTMACSLPNIVIKPDRFDRYFTEICPLVYSLALRLRNTKVPVWTHESIGYPKMDISHWDAAIHYGVQLAQYCDQNLSCLIAISRRLNPLVLPCPKTQEHQSTCVDSWVHRVPESGHQPLGRGNPLWRSACPILWSNPFLFTLFHGDCPSVLPCPKTQEHQSTCVDSWVHRVPENGHQPLGSGNSLWRAACPILWSNPTVLRYFTKIAPSVLPCPKTQEHFQSTCVDSWVHRVPENGHQSLGRGNSLWRSACPILWSNPFLLRYFTEIAILCAPLPQWLRNIFKVPVWTHESIGYPKMDISHWDAAIHYGVQLAQYCDQTRSWLRYFTEIAPCVLPCPKTQEHQSTCVDSWVHRVPENGHQPLGRGNSLWRAACPILWSNPIVLRYFTQDCPFIVLPCHKTQEHQSTCVDSWVHRVPESGHQPLGRGNTLWRLIAQYCDQTLSCYAISRRLPPLCSLAPRLRNTKVPVWTHESIGYPKMFTSAIGTRQFTMAIQLAQYCDQTRSFNAISRRSPPVNSLAPRLRNTKVPVWTHESIGYPKMDISHWDAAIHYGVQLAQYCDQTLSGYTISRRLPLCAPLP